MVPAEGKKEAVGFFFFDFIKPILNRNIILNTFYNRSGQLFHIRLYNYLNKSMFVTQHKLSLIYEVES
jgi:hypothetical protein